MKREMTTAIIAKSEMDLSGNGAAYLRVSDDKQDMEAQRQLIHKFEDRHGVKIKKAYWFEDKDWSRDEHDRRPDWLKMLAIIDRGEVQWLVVEIKDRFGTASGRKKVVYYDRLWEAGCKLYTTSGELLNQPSLASDINALVDGDTEERELRIKSLRATNKMQLTAEAGKWTGGPIPIGLDVVCMSLEGKELWRVISEGAEIRERKGKDGGKEEYPYRLRLKVSADGSEARYDGPENFPAHDAKDWLTLRPSQNADLLQIIRDIFNWYDTESITTCGIASRLNKQGRSCPIHWRWEPYHITYMLKNPVYIGYPTFNKIGQGKWSAWRDGQVVEHATPKRQNYKNARSDWKPSKIRQFDEIVPEDQFERVYTKIATGESRPKAPKAPGLWLSGILVCAGCGETMYGAKRRKRDVYWCQSHVKKIPGCKCGLNTLEHKEIEQHLRKYLADAGKIIEELDISVPVDPSPADVETFRQSVERAKRSYYEMARAVGKHGRKSDEPGKILLNFINPPYENGTDDITEAYNRLFSNTSPRLQAEHDQINEEHSRLVAAWGDLPSARAKEKARTRLAELEAQLEELEQRLVNHSVGWSESLGSLQRVQRDWRQMAEDISSEKSGRVKADAVRKIIAEIRCTFEKTGLHRPANRLIKIEFVPKIGQSTMINTEESARPRRFPSCG
jgi:DNA invertase Pin-like site-specific DNA recombinase